MIKRHLNDKQRAALECLAMTGTLPVTCAATHQLTQATLSYLKREKLVVINDAGSYAITEAGRAAIECGLYEKQPQMLIIPEGVKKADAGRTAHLNYSGQPGSKV